MVVFREDCELVYELRDSDVLQNVRGHLLDLRRGVILVTCADGDRVPDIYSYKLKIVAEQCTDPRIHLLSWNGGAIRLAKGHGCRGPRINKDGRSTDRDLLDEIHDSVAIKGIHTVALLAHWPCAKALACELTLLHVLKLLFEAKARIKHENEGVMVAPFFHVDWGVNPDGMAKKRTYFGSRKAFEDYIAAHYASQKY